MAAGSVALSTPQACTAGEAVSNLHGLSAYPASFRPLCAVEMRLQVAVPRIALEWVSVRSRFKRSKLWLFYGAAALTYLLRLCYKSFPPSIEQRCYNWRDTKNAVKHWEGFEPRLNSYGGP